MDLLGSSTTRSIKGKIYALVIVDDFFQYNSTFIIASKNEAFKVFKRFAKSY